MEGSRITNMIRSLHPLVLISTLIVLAALLTYVVPAGVFDRVADPDTGRAQVVAGSYHLVEGTPVGAVSMLMSVNKGIIDSAAIISFLILIGGSFGVVNSTGAIASLMSWLVLRFKSDRGKRALIVMLISFFALCSATFGMNLEALVFVPFCIVHNITTQNCKRKSPLLQS